MAAILLLLVAMHALPSRAQEKPEPFVGSTTLDSELDISSVHQSIGLNLAVQSAIHGVGMVAHLRRAELWKEVSGQEFPAGGGAIPPWHPQRAHTVCGLLGMAYLGSRFAGAVLSWSSSSRLANALVGFTFPFLITAGIEAVKAVVAFDAGIRLALSRAYTDTLAAPIRFQSMRSRNGLFAAGILSVINAVAELVVGINASAFAVAERKAGGDTYRPQVSIIPSPASVTLRVDF